MKTVSVTVQIPDGWELACDEMRPVKTGEYYFLGVVCRAEYPISLPMIVIRQIEPWKQPEFLQPGWIAMDKGWRWWWHESEPEIATSSSVWDSDDEMSELVGLNWTPPQCDDWKQSKRRIE